MKYLSVCSGIEAASVAWQPLGWSPVAFAQFDPLLKQPDFPSRVLQHRYPDVPNLGDMTRFKEWPCGIAPDLLVGGTPCQSFSVAGLRKGLEDPRGNLALTYCAILDRYQPKWFIWENVPGVLSTDGGRAFGSILGAMAELGYGWAYRVLDAQYVRVDGFGRAVPQRRRRVFVVGCAGSWRRAAKVLFERESLQGNLAPRRQTGKSTSADVAPSIVSSGRGFERTGDTRGQDPVIAIHAVDYTNGSLGDVAGTLEAAQSKGNRGQGVLITDDIARCDTAGYSQRLDWETENFVAAFSITPSNSNKDYNARLADKAQALTAHGNRPSARGGDLIAFSAKDYGADAQQGVSPTLRAGGHISSHANAGVMPAIAFAHQVGGNRSVADAFLENHSPTLQVTQTMAIAFQPRFARNGRGAPDVVASALTSEAGSTGRGDSAQCIAIQERAVSENPKNGPQGKGYQENLAFTREARNKVQAVGTGGAVRRLTPRECERLQGFPDDYTLIPGAADGPRYKALGNSMAVNVMRWLGRRIEMVEGHLHAALAAERAACLAAETLRLKLTIRS